MDLPGHGLVEGHWDLRSNVDSYLGRQALRGKSVLDVGCASGFLSFEMEKRGARVTSFDADHAGRYHHLPFRDQDFMGDHDAWLEQNNQWLTRLHNSYWFAHRAHGFQICSFARNTYRCHGKPAKICTLVARRT